jgi:deoxyribodipyrimidine photolyase
MNKHQYNFAIKNNLSFEHKLRDIIIDELSLMPKSYSVFSAFKKKFLSLYKFDNLPSLKRSHKRIISIINKTPKEPYDISSFLCLSNIGLFDSLAIANHYKNTSKYNYLLNQFLWRAFYYQVIIPTELYEFNWPIDLNLQKRFFNAQTGYKLIDAAIACLRATGKMTNRHRMLCGMFFCKNLLQPWMDGEKFFKKYLEDYDEYLNRGNWIWCSQLKFDNQQFIRFMSPMRELKKLTPEQREWLYEWEQPYIDPCIDWNDSCNRFKKWFRKR